MLQVVLGFDAATIASAFLVAPAAMSQRLVRAKAKIAQAGITFELPPREAWPERLGSSVATFLFWLLALWIGKRTQAWKA